MAAAFEQILAGNLEAAAGLAAPFDYEVIRFTDTATGREHVLLAEQPAGDLVLRGWVLYVHTPDSETTVTIQAAFPQSATFSERLAVQTFDAIEARNLFVAGAHRQANDADDLDPEPANVTRDANSVFHRTHQAVTTGPDDIAIETLGASGGDREIVVTAGAEPPTELAEQIAAGLTAHDYDVCLFGDGVFTRHRPSTSRGSSRAPSTRTGWPCTRHSRSGGSSSTGRSSPTPSRTSSRSASRSPPLSRTRSQKRA